MDDARHDQIASQRRGQPGSGSVVAPTYWWYRARAELLRSFFGSTIAPDDAVLDVGSADGPSVGWLNEQTRVALDVHPEGLVPPGVCASALAMPFDDASFDVVTAFDVIEHFLDDAAVLAEVGRVLRPGGLLAVSVPAYRWAWSSFDVQAGHHRRYTRRTIVEALVSAGFIVERASYAFAATFPFFAADRLRARLSGRMAERPREAAVSAGTQRFLAGLTTADRAMLGRWRLPFGSSIFVAARR